MVPLHEIDLKTGAVMATPGDYDEDVKPRNWTMRVVRGLF